MNNNKTRHHNKGQKDGARGDWATDMGRGLSRLFSGSSKRYDSG